MSVPEPTCKGCRRVRVLADSLPLVETALPSAHVIRRELLQILDEAGCPDVHGGQQRACGQFVPGEIIPGAYVVDFGVEPPRACATCKQPADVHGGERADELDADAMRELRRDAHELYLHSERADRLTPEEREEVEYFRKWADQYRTRLVAILDRLAPRPDSGAR